MIQTRKDAESTIQNRLAAELAIFDTFAKSTRIGQYQVERVDEYGFVLHPDGRRNESEKSIDLLLMGIVHGEEYAGLPTLNQLCRYIASGIVRPNISVGFLLGNVEAAKKGTRFVERDLNRAFGLSSNDTVDDRRARLMEPIMARAKYSIDLHQTIEPSETPFFIFSYNELSLRLASAVNPEIPVITHWGRAFSKELGGATSDEFVHRAGGTALTIELGQKGFGIYQISKAVKVCLDILLTVENIGAGGKIPSLEECENQIYTWAAIFPYPAGNVRLDEGFFNFKSISIGDRLGLHDGAPLLAEKNGLILFPKYRRSEKTPKPAELYRLLRPASIAELGKGDCMAE